MTARTLLVVDDDAGNRALLRVFFEKKGYVVKEAPDGDGGLDALRAGGVDVVLLDQMMPGKTGLDVLRVLRADGFAVPVIMLTADSAPETAVAAMDAGADDHVTKPFSLPVLFARVERRLRAVVDDEPEIVDVEESAEGEAVVAVDVSPASSPDGLFARLKKRLFKEPLPDVEVGLLLGGRYRLDQMIGKGSMGSVWRARHVELDHDVAVKVLHKDTKPVRPGESARESFRREGLLLARVRHRHVVRAHDAGIDPSGHAFLVMELLHGESIRVRLQREGGLPVQVACGVVADVAAALAACHRHGVVHRDVKAWNVFLSTENPDESPCTKLVDFGAACSVDDTRQHTLLVGTPSHMAPERFTDPKATPASDVYALGVMLHQLLTGALPFVASDVEGLAKMHQQQKPPAPSALRFDLPAGTDDTVGRLLRKLPEERPSAADAAVLLRSIARSQEKKLQKK